MCSSVYPDAFRDRSRGASVSEMHLNKLCDRALLSLWCFRNPYSIQKTKKELCDELVIFKNHIFANFGLRATVARIFSPPLTDI